MRTFEQYINESRQSYIFGGTDNRNTELNKTFGELVPGDTIYVSGKNIVVAATFVRLKHGSVDTFSYTYKDATGPYTIVLDKHSYTDLLSSNIAIADNINKWIVSTDAGTIIEETNKMFNTNLTLNDITHRETDKIDN